MLGSDESVICLQIPADYDINILISKELVRNDTAYLNTVRELNGGFLNKYDLKELDHNGKYQYLDRPNGNPTRIRDSVLIANEQSHNNPAELLPRLRCYNMTAPAVPPKPLSRPGSGIGEYTLSKDTMRNLEKLGIYDDVKLSDLEEKNFEYEKLQESISDDSFNDSSDDVYEEIDHLVYNEVDDAIVTLPYRMSKTSHYYEDMSSDEECYTASPGGMRVKPAKTKSKDTGKASVLTALKLKFRIKGYNCENLHENVDGDKKSSRQQSVPIDLSAPRSKSDGTNSLRTTKTESKTKKSYRYLFLKENHSFFYILCRRLMRLFIKHYLIILLPKCNHVRHFLNNKLLPLYEKHSLFLPQLKSLLLLNQWFLVLNQYLLPLNK